jgi:hypothetical protein
MDAPAVLLEIAIYARHAYSLRLPLAIVRLSRSQHFEINFSDLREVP